MASLLLRTPYDRCSSAVLEKVASPGVGSSVLDDLLEGAGVGIDQDEDRRVLVVLVEADVPGGVTVARSRRRAERNRVALRDVGTAVLLGDRVELRAVTEERRGAVGGGGR